MEETMTFRTRAGNFLNSNFIQWIVIAGFVFLTFWKDDLSYFLGLGYILLFLWAKKWDWNLIGLRKPKSWKKLWFQAVFLSVLLIILIDIVFTPILEAVFGVQPDISSFDSIRGDFLKYSILIILMWIVAAFGEEIVYRGLLVERLGILLGKTNVAFWVAVLSSSILFGLAHEYQGVSGMFSTGIAGFIFGAIYMKSKNRLWLTILTHGVYDTILITLMYLEMDNQVYDLLKNLF